VLFRSNDKIIAVNHEPIIGLDISEAVDLIRGEKGTHVLLTILRENNKENRRDYREIEFP
jgi:carboxyl-terminal processing protease